MQCVSNMAAIFLFSVLQPVTLKNLHLKEDFDEAAKDKITSSNGTFNVLHNIMNINFDDDGRYFKRFARHVEALPDTKAEGMLARMIKMMEKSNKHQSQTQKEKNKTSKPFFAKIMKMLKFDLKNGKMKKDCKQKKCQRNKVHSNRSGKSKTTTRKYVSGEEESIK